MSKGIPSVIKLFIVAAVGLAAIARTGFVEARLGAVKKVETPKPPEHFFKKLVRDQLDNLFVHEMYMRLKKGTVDRILIEVADDFNSGRIDREEYDSILTELPQAIWLRSLDKAHSNFQRFADFAIAVDWHLTPADEKFVPQSNLPRLTN